MLCAQMILRHPEGGPLTQRIRWRRLRLAPVTMRRYM